LQDLLYRSVIRSVYKFRLKYNTKRTVSDYFGDRIG
jgi:hypothetical protein